MNGFMSKGVYPNIKNCKSLELSGSIVIVPESPRHPRPVKDSWNTNSSTSINMDLYPKVLKSVYQSKRKSDYKKKPNKLPQLYQHENSLKQTSLNSISCDFLKSPSSGKSYTKHFDGVFESMRFDHGEFYYKSQFYLSDADKKNIEFRNGHLVKFGGIVKDYDHIVQSTSTADTVFYNAFVEAVERLKHLSHLKDKALLDLDPLIGIGKKAPKAVCDTNNKDSRPLEERELRVIQEQENIASKEPNQAVLITNTKNSQHLKLTSKDYLTQSTSNPNITINKWHQAVSNTTQFEQSLQSLIQTLISKINSMQKSNTILTKSLSDTNKKLENALAQNSSYSLYIRKHDLESKAIGFQAINQTLQKERSRHKAEERQALVNQVQSEREIDSLKAYLQQYDELARSLTASENEKQALLHRLSEFKVSVQKDNEDFSRRLFECEVEKQRLIDTNRVLCNSNENLKNDVKFAEEKCIGYMGKYEILAGRNALLERELEMAAEEIEGHLFEKGVYERRLRLEGLVQ